MLPNQRQAHRRRRALLAPLFQPPRMTQRVNKRKKRGVAEKLSVRRRNALARNLVGQSITNTMIGRVIVTDLDPALQPSEGPLTKEIVAAGRLPVIARSAVIG